MKKPKDKPPECLTAEAKAMWKRIHEPCEWDEPALALLGEMMQAWDRLQQARAILQAEGITVQEETAAGKTRTKVHPCVQVERDSLAGFTRCWRLLGFDLQPPK